MAVGGVKVAGLLLELVSWVPFLLLISLVAGASLAEGMIELPGWSEPVIDFYRSTVHKLAEDHVPDAPTWAIDGGIAGIGLLSLFARTTFNLLLSVVVFVVLAGAFGFGTKSLF